MTPINAWAPWGQPSPAHGTISLSNNGILTVSASEAGVTGPRRGIRLDTVPGDVLEIEMMARAVSGKPHIFANWSNGTNLLSETVVGSEFKLYRCRFGIPAHMTSGFVDIFVGLYAGDGVGGEGEFYAPRIRRNGLPVQCVVRASLSANQTVTTGSLQTALFNTAVIDPYGFIDATNYRVTPLISGIYAVSAAIRFNATADDAYHEVRIRRSGSNMASTEHRAKGASSVTVNCSTIMRLNGTNDYVDVGIQQNSGADRVVSSTNWQTRLELVRVADLH